MSEARAPAGQPVDARRFPFAARDVGGASTTFCNYAVNKQLRMAGVPTQDVSRLFPTRWRPEPEPSPLVPTRQPPKVPTWLSLAYRDIGRGMTHGANTISTRLGRSATSSDGVWRDIPENYAQVFADHVGACVVAARHGDPDPTRRGRFRPGHVALVRPLPQIDLGPAFDHDKAPYLNNVGDAGNTQIIPAGQSHPDFQYFVNRHDPQIRKAFSVAAVETDPDFQGLRSDASKHLFDVVRRARIETSPTFEGPPSPSTSFLTRAFGWDPHGRADLNDPLRASLSQMGQNVIQHERNVQLLRDAARRM